MRAHIHTYRYMNENDFKKRGMCGLRPYVSGFKTFNERPPRPKYQPVWDVDLVCNMFRVNGSSKNLSIKDLTIKTAMLFALTHPCKGALIWQL